MTPVLSKRNGLLVCHKPKSCIVKRTADGVSFTWRRFDAKAHLPGALRDDVASVMDRGFTSLQSDLDGNPLDRRLWNDYPAAMRNHNDVIIKKSEMHTVADGQ